MHVLPQTLVIKKTHSMSPIEQPKVQNSIENWTKKKKPFVCSTKPLQLYLLPL